MKNKGVIIAAVLVLFALCNLAWFVKYTGMGMDMDSMGYDIHQLEQRLAVLEKRLAGPDNEVGGSSMSAGLASPESLGPGGEPGSRAADVPADKDVMKRLRDVEFGLAESHWALSDSIDERVEAAVDEKVSELEKKRDPRPTLQVFAEVLDLNEDQRTVVEESIRLGQSQVRGILDIPTADGSSLVDGLVEALAYREAGHPEAGRQFVLWMGKVVQEKIPGSDQTYGAQIRVVKDELNETFRRELTPAQFAELESWQVDPTRVREVPDSPWDDLGGRIAKRARELSD